MEWASLGIRVNPSGPNEQKTTCPACSKDRTKSKERCLSVNVREGIYNCHHCGLKGSIYYKSTQRQYSPLSIDMLPLTEQMLDNFEKRRGIPRSVLERNRVSAVSRITPSGPKTVLAFPYLERGEVYNVKYKWYEKVEGGFSKRFSQEQDAKPLPFKLDDIWNTEDVIITEGEEDALSFEVAGLLHAVSIPGGAVQPGQDAEGKLTFIQNAFEAFEHKKRIYLACDMDAPGRYMNEQIARRLGRIRCYIVTFPEGCKDANETLVKHGPEALTAAIEGAEPYPVEGLFTMREMEDSLLDIYENGYPEGMTLGDAQMDEHARLMPGLIVAITGIPNHGKSNWWDWALARMSAFRGYKHALFTPENYPPEVHAQRLAQILVGKPLDRVYKDRMEKRELREAIDFIHDHFVWIRPTAGQENLDDLLNHFADAVARYGVKTITIDPWNRIHHKYDGREDQYISDALNKVEHFLQLHSLVGAIIAHPTKPLKNFAPKGERKSNNRYECPGLYDIAGAAHWYNKSGYGFVVYRNFDTKTTEVKVQKVKHIYWGKIGEMQYHYDPLTNRYNERPHPEFDRTNWLHSLGSSVHFEVPL